MWLRLNKKKFNNQKTTSTNSAVPIDEDAKTGATVNYAVEINVSVVV